MHILQEFLLNRVAPQLEALEKKAERPTKRRRQADFFESFLWLHLGSEVQAFPAVAVEALYGKYYKPFFAGLNAKPTDIPKALFRGQLYVYDTPQSTELKAAFPNHVILVEKAMRGDDVFAQQLSKFKSVESLRPLFRSLLFLSTRLWADPSVQRFAEAIQFFDEVQWEQSWQSGVCEPEHVIDCVEGDGTDTPAAIVYAGYLSLWKTTYQLQRMFENCANDPDLKSDDRFKFTERIRDIVGWRLNVRSIQASTHFDQVVSTLKANLDAQALRDLDLQRAVDEIKTSFDSVFEFYLSFATATT